MRPRLLSLAYDLLLIVAAVLIATALDYAVHSLSESFAVPGYYFRNKLIFGVLWACVFFYVFRNVRGIAIKSAWVAGAVAVLLQLRYYFIEGYTLWFVLLFLVLHFLMFWAGFVLVFKLPRIRSS